MLIIRLSVAKQEKQIQLRLAPIKRNENRNGKCQLKLKLGNWTVPCTCRRLSDSETPGKILEANEGASRIDH